MLDFLQALFYIINITSTILIIKQELDKKRKNIYLKMS
jgi:hypothetical protein